MSAGDHPDVIRLQGSERGGIGRDDAYAGCMATPSHLPYVVRGLSELPHEELPVRGETEDQYCKRVVAEIRRHERAERRRRIAAWLRLRQPRRP